MIMDGLALEQFEIDCRRFPKLPIELKDETLYFLLLQMVDQPLTTQRNFFAYVHMYADTGVYERFYEIWKEEFSEELEKISPSC